MKSKWLISNLFAALAGAMLTLVFAADASRVYFQNVQAHIPMNLSKLASKALSQGDHDAAVTLVNMEIQITKDKTKNTLVKSDRWPLFFPLYASVIDALLTDFDARTLTDIDKSKDLGVLKAKLGYIRDTQGQPDEAQRLYMEAAQMLNADTASMKNVAKSAFDAFNHHD